jgi:hypothetical protein
LYLKKGGNKSHTRRHIIATTRGELVVAHRRCTIGSYSFSTSDTLPLEGMISFNSFQSLIKVFNFDRKVGFFKRKKPGYTPAPTDDKDNLNTY